MGEKGSFKIGLMRTEGRRGVIAYAESSLFKIKVVFKYFKFIF